ncbi:stage II sporulation protein AB (anti-sigma F factor) [Gracilibacillus ureilyticus]|uniref:Anti-sigma F factor n=1 Tax=Gracilibacillus ureilyticus TaxID=531814 RepID=A0A1H9LT85_9BACI|nr:anti-sigma F factor [Gracilibacillus ureilyticus]SER14722.1 stage II sporulation protein AB (anti-sigma F factor) [Gracilibacillus ureilyticus]
MNNSMQLQFKSISENEAFARVSVAAFVSQIDPTMNEITEIKTVVSEAVTNAIIHGYEEDPNQTVFIECEITDSTLSIVIEDHGIGIDNVDLAKEPLFTSKPELERSGMGFTIMENFMDKVNVISKPGIGTKVTLIKDFQTSKSLCN